MVQAIVIQTYWFFKTGFPCNTVNIVSANVEMFTFPKY